jgi:hypothetical protein
MSTPVQPAAIRAPAKRKKWTPQTLKCWPVGARPMKPPSSVAVIVQRTATRSPSAAISSTASRRSGNAARSMATCRFSPSGPVGVVAPGATYSSANSSSAIARWPWFQTSS